MEIKVKGNTMGMAQDNGGPKGRDARVVRVSAALIRSAVMRLVLPGALLGLLCCASPAKAESAGAAYNKGQDLEARQDYEGAYASYLEAYRQKPKDLVYRAAVLRIRLTAAGTHVHRGQQLRAEGSLQEALKEFEKATEIDPSSFMAEQEIRRTNVMIESAAHGNSPNPVKGAQSRMRQRIDQTSEPVELAPLSTAPVTLKIQEDSKVVWSMLGKLAGLNVAFDPDYSSKKISVDLKDVNLAEIFKVVSLESKAFWKAVTPNTILVAADSQGKRKEIEDNVIMTYYLSNVAQASDLQDVVTTLHNALDISHLTPIPSQNAVIVRGTPDQVALAGKLIDDIDKARAEVVVEVMVMQVNREKIQNLGVTPPTSVTASIQGSAAASTNGASGLTLNDLAHLNATNFAVTIPSATATFLASDSQSKLIQNPQIRTMDGQKATLKIGERVPVATGSFSSGIGGAGVSPLVNTQFQYLDVGVNIDITPRVYSNNDVSMKVSIDISSVDSTTNIGGISQPVIGQHKLEHEIRLREGEVNVIGGMLEDSDSKNSSGYPWLSSVPLLKYFFSSHNTDKRNTELVFVVVPRVVRGHEWNEMNTRPLGIGTSNVIELQHASAEVPQSAKPVAPKLPTDLNRAEPIPAKKGAAPQVGALKPKTGTSLSFNSSNITTTEGETFVVDVLVDGAQNLISAPMGVQFDPDKLELKSVASGPFLKKDGNLVAISRRDDPPTNTTWLTADRPSQAAGVSGNGSLLSLTFVAKSAGATTLSISPAGLKDQGARLLSNDGSDTVVRVRSKS